MLIPSVMFLTPFLPPHLAGHKRSERSPARQAKGNFLNIESLIWPSFWPLGTCHSPLGTCHFSSDSGHRTSDLSCSPLVTCHSPLPYCFLEEPQTRRVSLRRQSRSPPCRQRAGEFPSSPCPQETAAEVETNEQNQSDGEEDERYLQNRQASADMRSIAPPVTHFACTSSAAGSD